MKTNTLRRFFCSLIVIFLLLTNIPAQDAFGNYRLVSLPSPPLRTQTPIRVSSRSPRFLFKVGGVAFDGIAKPQTGVQINSLSLDYLKDQPDGNRLSVIVNGANTSPQIYDWQLIPIAKFADTSDNACVTLFGTLGSKEMDEEVKIKRGSILNYHEAFTDTLMGLRLFQLDMLIFSPYAHDLPTEKGKYILGAGEAPPNKEANEKARLNFKDFMKYKLYDSYIISDLDRTTEFNSSSADLNLNGEPSYFFWQLDGDLDFDDESYNQQTQIRTAKSIARRANPRKFNEKQWIIGQIITEAQNFDQKFGNVNILPYTTNFSLIETLQTEPAQRRSVMQNQLVEDLTDDLAQLRASLKVFKVQFLTELNTQVSEKTDVIRTINPAVWDAGVILMRYASFFRYYKQKYPTQWSAFINKIKQAPKPKPEVRTPTVIYPQGFE